MNTTNALTIAALETASDAASAALSAAEAHLDAVSLAIKALVAVRDLVSFDGALTEDDKSDLGDHGATTGICRLRAKIPGIKAEIDRLEDVALAAARELNEAPAEAA